MRNCCRRRDILLAGALFLALAVPAAAETVRVTIDNFTFTPATLQVKAGTTVSFLNRDDIPHSVVSETGAFHSRAFDTDESFTFTFAKVGEFPYFCGLHPHMKAKIVVTP